MCSVSIHPKFCRGFCSASLQLQILSITVEVNAHDLAYACHRIAESSRPQKLTLNELLASFGSIQFRESTAPIR
jgi:hypothetical protein